MPLMDSVVSELKEAVTIHEMFLLLSTWDWPRMYLTAQVRVRPLVPVGLAWFQL